MSFFHRYRSPTMQSVLRVPPKGILVGREISVQFEFMADTLDPNGDLVPTESFEHLDASVRALFDGKLLIDNCDPYADDLVKLSRIKAADPVLFAHGTTGPQLAFYMAQWSAEWLDTQQLDGVRVVLAVVQVGRDEFLFDLA